MSNFHTNQDKSIESHEDFMKRMSDSLSRGWVNQLKEKMATDILAKASEYPIPFSPQNFFPVGQPSVAEIWRRHDLSAYLAGQSDKKKKQDAIKRFQKWNKKHKKNRRG